MKRFSESLNDIQLYHKFFGAERMQQTKFQVAEDMDLKFLCHQNALLMMAIDAEAIEDAEKLLRESQESASAVVNVPCGRLQLTALQLAAAKGKYKNWYEYETWYFILKN
jgi:hypothetical protein